MIQIDDQRRDTSTSRGLDLGEHDRIDAVIIIIIIIIIMNTDMKYRN